MRYPLILDPSLLGEKGVLFFSREATMPASDAAREVRLGIKKVRFMVKKPSYCVLNDLPRM
jgi:hypothetical protein